jgi:hypothetical protein
MVISAFLQFFPWAFGKKHYKEAWTHQHILTQTGTRDEQLNSKGNDRHHRLARPFLSSLPFL